MNSSQRKRQEEHQTELARKQTLQLSDTKSDLADHLILSLVPLPVRVKAEVEEAGGEREEHHPHQHTYNEQNAVQLPLLEVGKRQREQAAV